MLVIVFTDWLDRIPAEGTEQLGLGLPGALAGHGAGHLLHDPHVLLLISAPGTGKLATLGMWEIRLIQRQKSAPDLTRVTVTPVGREERRDLGILLVTDLTSDMKSPPPCISPCRGGINTSELKIQTILHKKI